MKNKEIIEYLEKLIINPKCELNYKKDYELVIAVMLSAQTTDKRVNEVTEILFKKYNSLDTLANADVNDIKNIIKPLGTYNIKAPKVIEIAKSLNKIGYVPNDRKYLDTLNGVGRKTTNVILSELFNEQCIAVDTHVERVSKRLGLANKKDDVLKVEKKLTKIFKDYNAKKIHHQLLLFGRYYCKSKNPLCDTCELKSICKYKKKD